jgi:hypothetical protein
MYRRHRTDHVPSKLRAKRSGGGDQAIFCLFKRLTTIFEIGSIICVAGYGTQPETTWHHQQSGKTWIKDDEFLSQLNGPVRVFDFHFNGDVAANLSAASIAFHADDLLSCIENALGKRPVCSYSSFISTTANAKNAPS